MATDVTLPQLGESVTEGTITAWLVNVGDHVDADQPLFELSSDKIDTEVPAPAAGVLTEILVNVDETVEVGTVVARIGAEGEGGGAAPAEAAPAQEAAPAEQPAAAAQASPGAEPSAQAEPAPQAEAQPAPAVENAEQQAPAAQPAQPAQAAPAAQPAAAKPPLTSPLARREASEAGVDVNAIQGSGQGGRVTRQDVQAAASGQSPASGQAQGQAQAATPQPQPARPPLKAGERERLEDLSRIRQRIAAKMMESMQSSAQLTTVQEADVTRIMQLRSRVKNTFAEREGVSLSPFVFMARAAVIAIKRHELANAQADWQAAKVRIPEYVNLGIAVDTEKGLLVPNVKNADDLTLPALARAIDEVARKARGELKLEMQDIEGGTFTVTNTGSRGVLIDTPILNYPEVAVLATGAIQKRPVVADTETGPSIAIRDMVYLCLTYDHRLLDGADAARFVTDVKQVIETHDWESEIGY